MYDLDGSLTDYAGGTALPFYSFNEWEGQCKKADDAEGRFTKGHDGMVCNDKVRVRRLQLLGNEPRELDDKKIYFKKSQSVAPTPETSEGRLVDRFGQVDELGGLDWRQFNRTGLLYEGCDKDTTAEDLIESSSLKEGLLGWWRVDGYDGKALWSDRSGAGNDAILEGGAAVLTDGGHGAGRPVEYIRGTPTTAVRFPNALAAEFTVCAVTRYTSSGKKGRILQSGRENWLQGHWSGISGVAHYGSWATTRNTKQNAGATSDWVVMCGQNEGAGRILVDSDANNVRSDAAAKSSWDTDLTINTGAHAGESSDFGIVELLSWSRALNEVEMQVAMKYLRSRLGLERHLSVDADIQKTNSLSFSGCKALQGLDFINYRQAGLVSGEFDGWALPLVTQHDYYADIDWHIDFQKMTMRWSEPFYFKEPYNKPLVNEESVMLRWPYIDYRYRYRVSYAGGAEKPWYDHRSVTSDNVTRQLTRKDEFGAGLILRNDDSLKTTNSAGEWKLALNPWLGIDETVGEDKSMLLDTAALSCGPTMCGLPGDNSFCMQGDGVTWDDAKCPPMLWSEISTWGVIAGKEKNTADVEHTGALPTADAKIEIPANTYIILDVDTPVLDKLVVVGRLKFDGNRRTLSVHRMLVWGEVEIGTRVQPYTEPAEIILHGRRADPTLVATDQHFLGNKNLVVFGKITMAGTPTPVQWTTLATTAAVNQTSLAVATDVRGWRVGDKIVVTGTEYPEADGFEDRDDASLDNYHPHQEETLTITAIKGRTITFAEPLIATHFAGKVADSMGRAVVLAAHVGLLSHNIKVSGNFDSADWYTGYGGHVVVGEVNYGSEDELAALRAKGETLGITRLLGSLDVAHVHFEDMGKLASEHPAIQFRFFSDLDEAEAPRNRIDSCSFVNSFNYVVSTDKSFSVEIVNNVVQQAFRSAVDIDLKSRGTIMRNNLVSAVLRSPDQYNPDCKKDASCWNHPFAGFFVWNKFYAELSGNVVAGSEDGGFIVYPVDECAQTGDGTKMRMGNNQAYGTLVGLFLLDVNKDTCHTVQGFKAWKNAHLGIVTVDQSANLKLVDVTVADNHIGISLNFVRTGWRSFSSIERSVILGSTVASTCAASVDCRSVKRGDERGLKCNSEPGSKFRRIGILMPQYTNLKRTCEGQGSGGVCRPPNRVFRMCSLPWDTRFGNVDVQHAAFTINQTTFAHWSASDCGRTSRALALNPSQPDFAPETVLAALDWQTDNVGADARMLLGEATHQTMEAVACKTGSCDAVNYFKVIDADGTSMSPFANTTFALGEKLTLLSDFNPAAGRADKCKADPMTRSLVCRDMPLVRLVLESNPPRFTKRRLGPAVITKYSDAPAVATADATKYWSVGPFPQGCSCQKHFAQFTFDVEVGYVYDVVTSGVLQDQNRVTFHSELPSQCIVARIFFSKPMAIAVYDVDTETSVAPLATGRPTSGDAPGTHVLDPQERFLHITLCGGSNKGFWLDYGTNIQVTATIAMTMEEFFATNIADARTAQETFVNTIALLLAIPLSQIKVACVHPVGQPCLGRRRQRRASNANVPALANANASAAANATSAYENIDVQFELLPEQTYVGESGAVESSSFEDQQIYLTALLLKLRSAIADGTLKRKLAENGIALVGMRANYDQVYEAEGGADDADDEDSSSSDVALAVGVTVAVLLAVVVLVVAGLYLRRRKQNKYSDEVGGRPIPSTDTTAVDNPEYGADEAEEGRIQVVGTGRAPPPARAPPRRVRENDADAKFDGQHFARNSRGELQKDSLFDPLASTGI